tara:strand:+ start:345 stop:563 length:219 start_codon:yes stop_codon:yes gene_type:complete
LAPLIATIVLLTVLIGMGLRILDVPYEKTLLLAPGAAIIGYIILWAATHMFLVGGMILAAFLVFGLGITIFQ